MQKLKDYMQKKNLDALKFAEVSGIKYATVYKILKQGVTPTIKTAALIKTATNNKVKFEDWLK